MLHHPVVYTSAEKHEPHRYRTELIVANLKWLAFCTYTVAGLRSCYHESPVTLVDVWVFKNGDEPTLQEALVSYERSFLPSEHAGCRPVPCLWGDTLFRRFERHGSLMQVLSWFVLCVLTSILCSHGWHCTQNRYSRLNRRLGIPDHAFVLGIWAHPL